MTGVYRATERTSMVSVAVGVGALSIGGVERCGITTTDAKLMVSEADRGRRKCTVQGMAVGCRVMTPPGQKGSADSTSNAHREKRKQSSSTYVQRKHGTNIAPLCRPRFKQ